MVEEKPFYNQMRKNDKELWTKVYFKATLGSSSGARVKGGTKMQPLDAER